MGWNRFPKRLVIFDVVEGPLEPRAGRRPHPGVERGEMPLHGPDQLRRKATVGLPVAIERRAQRAAGDLHVLRVAAAAGFVQEPVHVVLDALPGRHL